MAKWGKCDYKQLQELQERVQKLESNNFDDFCEACAKELAARLLAKVIKRTPVGNYPNYTGKKGGTLRRGWTANNYANSLPIRKKGNMYTVEIINPVEYASYVEFGHRTVDHKGWVKGKFFLTISEQEVQNAAPAIIEKKIKKYLGECFND